MRLSLVPARITRPRLVLLSRSHEQRQEHRGHEQDEHAVAVDLGGAELEQRAGQRPAGTAKGLPGRPKVIRTRSGIMMARP